MIELKTTLKMIDAESPINIGNFAHDARTLHALLQAVESCGNKRFVSIVKTRAAEIHAAMMKGEG